MPTKKVDLDRLELDNSGRVVLTDDMLASVEDCESTASAGGLNGTCPSSTNQAGCTNGVCSNSSNSSCTNQVECSYSTNFQTCPTPKAVDEN